MGLTEHDLAKCHYAPEREEDPADCPNAPDRTDDKTHFYCFMRE